jgi:hypothetical protein
MIDHDLWHGGEIGVFRDLFARRIAWVVSALAGGVGPDPQDVRLVADVHQKPLANVRSSGVPSAAEGASWPGQNVPVLRGARPGKTGSRGSHFTHTQWSELASTTVSEDLRAALADLPPKSRDLLRRVLMASTEILS